MRYEGVGGAEGLARIEAEWAALAKRLPGGPALCHHPQWYRCLLEAGPDAGPPMRFGLARLDDRLVGVLPLVLRPRSRWGLAVRSLELPFESCFMRDVVVDPTVANLIHLGSMAHAGGLDAGPSSDLLVLDEFRDDSLLATSGILAGTWLRPFAVNWQCYHPVHDPSLADDLSAPASRWTRQMQRQLRKFGAVRYGVSDGAEESKRAVEGFLSLEASGWKGSAGAGTAANCRPRLAALIRSLARSEGGLECRVHQLFVGSRLAAAAVGLTLGPVHYVFKIGFDEEFARGSPGHALAFEIRHWCIAQPDVSELNWLSNAEWLDRWRPLRRPMLRWYGAPRSLRGTAAMIIGRCATAVAGARVEHGRAAWLRQRGRRRT